LLLAYKRWRNDSITGSITVINTKNPFKSRKRIFVLPETEKKPHPHHERIDRVIAFLRARWLWIKAEIEEIRNPKSLEVDLPEVNESKDLTNMEHLLSVQDEQQSPPTSPTIIMECRSDCTIEVSEDTNTEAVLSRQLAEATELASLEEILAVPTEDEIAEIELKRANSLELLNSVLAEESPDESNPEPDKDTSQESTPSPSFPPSKEQEIMRSENSDSETETTSSVEETPRE
jgi:hypothetical protein